MSDDLLMLGRRPPGRPRAKEQKVSVSAWVPISHVDALAQIANHGDKSMSQLIGEIVASAVERRPTR